MLGYLPMLFSTWLLLNLQNSIQIFTSFMEFPSGIKSVLSPCALIALGTYAECTSNIDHIDEII